MLGAAVDGLCHFGSDSSAQSGLSILHGPADAMLPGLWASSSASAGTTSITQPSLSVSLSPFLGDANPIQVTVPLANTVFQNNRPFTLLASRYRKQAQGSYKVSCVTEKDNQALIPIVPSIQSFSNISACLLPITQPRQIATGLGNIVRQLDIEGQISPASKELEANIPKLFETRSKASRDFVPGPIGVWAVVVPEHMAGSSLLPDASGFPYLGPGSEKAQVSKTANALSKLLASGCHIHRICEHSLHFDGPVLTTSFNSKWWRRLGIKSRAFVAGSSDEILAPWR